MNLALPVAKIFNWILFFSHNFSYRNLSLTQELRSSRRLLWILYQLLLQQYQQLQAWLMCQVTLQFYPLLLLSLKLELAHIYLILLCLRNLCHMVPWQLQMVAVLHNFPNLYVLLDFYWVLIFHISQGVILWYGCNLCLLTWIPAFCNMQLLYLTLMYSSS